MLWLVIGAHLGWGHSPVSPQEKLMQHLGKEGATLPPILELILRAQLPCMPAGLLQGSLGAGSGTQWQSVIHDSSLKRAQHLL